MSLWDADTGKLIPLSGGLEKRYMVAAFFIDGGKTLVSLAAKGEGRVGADRPPYPRRWDAATGEFLGEMPVRLPQRMDEVVASPCGRILACRTLGTSGSLLDWRTGEQVFLFRRPSGEGAFWSTTFGPDGRQLAFTDGSRARVFDLPTQKILFRQRPEAPGDEFSSVAFAGEGRNVLTSRGSVITYWNVKTGKAVEHVQVAAEEVTCLRVSPDGRLVAGVGRDNRIHVWEVASGEAVMVFTGHRGRVAGVYFSPDGRHLLSASSDTTAIIWSLDPWSTSGSAPPTDPAKLWDQLAAEDPRLAYKAVWACVRLGDPVRSALDKKMAPILADERRIAELVDKLGSAKYTEREQATKQLETIGVAAVPALRRALKAVGKREAQARAGGDPEGNRFPQGPVEGRSAARKGRDGAGDPAARTPETLRSGIHPLAELLQEDRSIDPQSLPPSLPRCRRGQIAQRCRLAGIVKDTPGLRHLGLRMNQEQHDLSTISQFSKLESLFLFDALSPKQLRSIGRMPSIRELGFGYAPVDIDDLSEQFPNLEHLCIQIVPEGKRLDGLDKLTKLRSLWLPQAEVTSVAFLAGMSELRCLKLGSVDWLVDISPIAKLTKLTSLEIQGGRRVSQASFDQAVSSHPNLKAFAFTDGTQVTDYSALAKLTDLECLDIHSTGPIDSLEFIATLTKLQYLDLSYRAIVDLRFLSKLTALEELQLRYADQVGSLAPAGALPALQYLSVDYAEGVEESRGSVKIEVAPLCACSPVRRPRRRRLGTTEGPAPLLR